MGRNEGNSHRIKEIVAMMMIGEGVIAAPEPRRHVGLWNAGPDVFRRLIAPFQERPGLTRALGVAELAFGVWWANRLVAD